LEINLSNRQEPGLTVTLQSVAASVSEAITLRRLTDSIFVMYCLLLHEQVPSCFAIDARLLVLRNRQNDCDRQLL